MAIWNSKNLGFSVFLGKFGNFFFSKYDFEAKADAAAIEMEDIIAMQAMGLMNGQNNQIPMTMALMGN